MDINAANAVQYQGEQLQREVTSYKDREEEKEKQEAMQCNRRFRKFHEQLNRIERKLDKMAVDQATFDAEFQSFMTDLDAQITNIDTAVQAILDKVQPAGIDLSAEEAQLKSAQDKIDNIVSQLPSSPTPPV